MADDKQDLDSITIAAELTAAWLSNPNVRAAADDVPAFLRNIHSTINELAGGGEAAAPAAEAEPAYQPAVTPRASIRPDYLISLIDGKRYKTLKRHLSGHGLTPEDYRKRYGLRPDYPMVAPNYSSMRREAAARIGLGRKRQDAEPPLQGEQGAAAAQTGSAPEPVAPAVDMKPASRRSRKAEAPTADHESAPAKQRRPRKSKEGAA
jgi:predicted transcriptional regulator